MLEVEQECGEPLEAVLDRHYNGEGLSYMEIGQKYMVNPDTVLLWMRNLHIPVPQIVGPIISLQPEIIEGENSTQPLVLPEVPTSHANVKFSPPVSKYFRGFRKYPTPRPTFKPLE